MFLSVFFFNHNPPVSFVHRSVANDRYSLWKMGITHVVNVAHGRMHCQGSRDFYGSTVDYYGVPADDSPSFDLSRYFFPAAEYIQSALDTAGGKYPSCCFIVTQFYLRLCRPLCTPIILSTIKSQYHLMLYAHCNLFLLLDQLGFLSTVLLE